MIQYELLSDQGILVVTPAGPLEKADFTRLARDVDPSSNPGASFRFS